MSIVEGKKRVLFVHAHPDDETLSTGALITFLRSRGIACDLVTATRGEEGEVVSGPLSHLAGTPQLHAHREAELGRALTVLGIERHTFLGAPPARAYTRDPRVYRDSGMQWVSPGVAGPSDTANEHSLTHGSIEEQCADLTTLVGAWGPDLLISYNSHGGYGHPDHVRMHEVTASVGHSTGIPVASICHERSDATEWFDLAWTLPTVAEALRHHASQLTVQPSGTEIVHSGGQREEIVTAVGLTYENNA